MSCSGSGPQQYRQIHLFGGTAFILNLRRYAFSVVCLAVLASKAIDIDRMRVYVPSLRQSVERDNTERNRLRHR